MDDALSGPLARFAFALPCRNALIDDESVVLDDKGLSDFALLGATLEAGHSGRMEFIAFDLLVIDEKNLRKAPLHERKHQLKALRTKSGGALRYGGFVTGDTARVFREATQAGAEGILAKRADGLYRGGRLSDSLQIKGDFREDVLIIGYRPSDKGASISSQISPPRRRRTACAFSGVSGEALAGLSGVVSFLF